MMTTAERSRLQPDVPSAREAGTDIDIDSWVALFAPAGTPNDIVGRVSAELRKVVDDPAFRDRMAPAGFETRSSTPEQVSETVKVDLARWKQIVKDTGIEPQ
jgi:tripartite-type tricarboxylate transporter receptor subunit TctC